MKKASLLAKKKVKFFFLLEKQNQQKDHLQKNDKPERARGQGKKT